MEAEAYHGMSGDADFISGGYNMSCNCNSGIFAYGSSWWWIIILIVLIVVFGGGCGNGCGCGNNGGCGCDTGCGNSCC